ncbi:contractile injection system protein, VgrG/Pvc8 family [Clostridium saccharobutylicum]|uniref:Late control protein D n=1 Tax=Clostridium saccharobutylicum TaxID=169679 RepID=A0A1S8NC11_CLOSA|nr:contractile injection system protein, VgrG/Pvc8 family [Clostridium saccharobutylicum]OOM13970.1 hypothetical protein CLOSAC_20560 [Clostridium saccharobutylicum]
MGEIHSLRVKSPYKLMNIVDIKIKNKPNKHGYLYLKCLIDDSINFNATIRASTDDKICIYEKIEDESIETNSTYSDDDKVNINEVNEKNSKRLFCGIVQNIWTTNTNGIYYLELEALTSSVLLDIKEKSRSFQNIRMTYDDLISEILKDYSSSEFVQNIGKGKKINKPIFQFKETDWNFLKRIASELKSELYCDIINSNVVLNFGIPNKCKYELDDDNMNYEAFKDLKRFHEVGGYNAGYNDIDFFYYQIIRRNALEIGAQIFYNQKDLYIREYEVYRNREEIFYKYKLCRKNGVWQNIVYNQLLRGATLDGKVLEVKEEVVKIHLDIDKSQNKDEAFWFPFLPPSVNIMYSMPLVGESVRLYFPNDSSEKPIIAGCSRKNGEECEKTSEPSKRYYETEHGSEIAMLPNALNIKGVSKKNMIMSFNDELGVHLKSSKKLKINSDEGIVIKTPKRVKINAHNQILLMKRNKSHSVLIEDGVYIKGNNVVMNGNSSEIYDSFEEREEDSYHER